MYLFLACLIRCDLKGLSEKSKLTWSGLRMPPDTFKAEEPVAMGIVDQLPGSLDESILCLEGDATLREVMGRQICDIYLKIKKKDALGFKEMSEEQRRRWFIKFFECYIPYPSSAQPPPLT